MLSEFETNGFYTERGFFSERHMGALRDEIDSIGLDFMDEMHPHKKSPTHSQTHYRTLSHK